MRFDRPPFRKLRVHQLPRQIEGRFTFPAKVIPVFIPEPAENLALVAPIISASAAQGHRELFEVLFFHITSIQNRAAVRPAP